MKIETMIDIMKADRVEPVSRTMLTQLLRAKFETVSKYVDEMVAQGVLIEGVPSKAPARGARGTVYWLSSHWGGQYERLEKAKQEVLRA